MISRSSFFILDAMVAPKLMKKIIKIVRNVLFICHWFDLYVKEWVYFFGFDFLPVISLIVAHVFIMLCLYFKKQLL